MHRVASSLINHGRENFSFNACFAALISLCVVRVLLKITKKIFNGAIWERRDEFEWSSNDSQIIFISRTFWTISNCVCVHMRGIVKKKKLNCTHFFSFAKFKFPENGIKMMDGARAKIPDVKCHKSSSTIDFIVLISISHIDYWALSSSYHRFWNCDHVAGWAIANRLCGVFYISCNFCCFWHLIDSFKTFLFDKIAAHCYLMRESDFR